MRAIRVLIIEDHPVTRMGLAALITAAPELELVGEADTAESGIASFARALPAVTLLDLRLPDRDGLEVIARLRNIAPAAKIIAVSAVTDADVVRQALRAGAAGFASKSTAPAALVRLIVDVAGGARPEPEQLREQDARPALTPRELEVLRLMGVGLRNQEIADALDVSVTTVRTHVAHILPKLDASVRTEAVANALRRGLI